MARRTAPLGGALPALLTVALLAGACDDGGATTPPSRDAGTGPMVLNLTVNTDCPPDRAPVRPGDPRLVRISLQTVREGGIHPVNAHALVFVEAGAGLRLDNAGDVTLQAGLASLFGECVQAGAVRIVADAPELDLRSESRTIHCLSATSYARQCGGPASDAGPESDAGLPPPADAGADAAPFPDAAPGGPALRADAPTKTALMAFGDRSQVLFTLVDESNTPWSDQQVTFSLDPPSARHSLTPTVATTDPMGRINVRLDTRGDLGRFRIVGGLAIDDRRIAGHSAPIEVSAGPLRAGGLRIECEAPAVAALDADGTPVGRSGRQCSVRAADPEDRPMAGITLTLITEAGTVPETAGPTGADGLATFEYETGGVPPVAVSPDPVPANGQATILAVTTGEEGFEDTDGDGVFTAGTDVFDPARDDLPEPFVDADDNGRRGEQEAFVDTDGGGRYSAGNGERDLDGHISTQFGMLWVGPHDAAMSHAEVDCSGGGCQANPGCGAPFGAPDGGAAHIRFTVADRNGNCVRTHRDDHWIVRWPGSADVTGPLADTCRDARGRPGAQPQRVAAPGLSARQGADEIPLTLDVEYDSVLGRRRFETTFNLCVIE